MSYLRPVAVVILFFGIIIYSFQISKTFHECVDQEIKTGRQSKSGNNFAGIVRIFTVNYRCGLELIDRKHDLFIASFTIVLATFTIFLWFATTEAAKAGYRAASIAQKALVESERAFVFIDGFNVELTTAADLKEAASDVPECYRANPDVCIRRFAVIPRWKNSGNTPTKEMKIQTSWSSPTGEMSDYSYRSPPETFFLGPNAVEPSRVFEVGASAIIGWEFHPVGDPPLVLIWGRADYKDVFDKIHFTEWCYRLRFERHKGRQSPMTASFVQWGDHNRCN
jgi:hypothetical protein